MCYKTEVQSNLNCWNSRNELVKFPLIWNMAFLAYLEGGRGDSDDDYEDDDDDNDDDDDDDKTMRTALS